ncbi:MAG: ATP-binding protein [Novosphingobium sp.]|nr:ATP-binding protein [Novosphingobium sp.]
MKWLELSRFSFATKVVLATGLIGLLSIAALTVYMYHGSENILVERDSERLAGSVEVSALRLNSRLEFGRQDTLLLSKTPPILGIFRANLQGGVDPLDGSTGRLWRDRLATIFAGMLEARPEYMQVRLIGAGDNGREIVRVDRLRDGTINRIPEQELQQKINRPYVRDTLRLNKGEIYLSRIDLNQEHGKIEVPNRPVIRVATPLFSETGERLGIIIINIDMGRIFQIIKGPLPDQAGFYLTNSDGDYLDHPQAEKTFGFDLGHRYLMQDEFPALKSFFAGNASEYRGMIDGPAGQLLTVAAKVRYDPQDDSQYVVISETIPASELAESMASVRNRAAAAAAVVLLFGLLAMAWLARSLARPLKDISDMAVAVSRGDRQVDIGTTGMRRDEVGALARSFETMVLKVDERETELAAEKVKLEQANDKLVRSNRELMQFAYVASHDLQEPLRMVDSYMGLIERRYKGKLDSDADEFIGYAVDGARRMKRLINELLSYSRVSNRPLKVDRVDTRALVEGVLAMLQGQIEQAGAEIEVGPLPTIEADPGQIERLFTNLIGNALKFRSDTPPHITVSAEQKDGMWEFAIADNGIGIDPEFQEKIFEIFARLHSRDVYDGTGIGLAACKRIVELHGGTIRVEPAPGGGSIFRFTLPERQEGEED